MFMSYKWKLYSWCWWNVKPKYLVFWTLLMTANLHCKMDLHVGHFSYKKYLVKFLLNLNKLKKQFYYNLLLMELLWIKLLENHLIIFIRKFSGILVTHSWVSLVTINAVSSTCLLNNSIPFIMFGKGKRTVS